MKSILARAQREVLQRFARSNVLLAFDFDGTLAPIVADRERAGMRALTAQRLAALTELYPVIVISGRARGDVLRRLEGVRMRSVIGNHGIEPTHARASLRQQVRAWRNELGERLAGLRGVIVEDKTYSISIHFRAAREKQRVRARIQGVLAGLHGARIIGGKQVLSVLPAAAPHKGSALERELRRLDCRTALYVGDDDTDEDVFALEQPGRVLSIRVGANRNSLAPYFIRSQREIDALLEQLLRLRSTPAADPTGRRRT